MSKKVSFTIIAYLMAMMALTSIKPMDAKLTVPKTSFRRPSTGKIREKVKKMANKVINSETLDDFLTGASKTFEDVEESVRLFQNLREKLKKNKNTTAMTAEDRLDLLDEMKICKPATHARCYSRCIIKEGTTYLWCHTTSNLDKWESCGCLLRQEVVDYFAMMREQILNPPMPPPPMSDTEVALTTTLTIVTILFIIVATLTIVYVKKVKKNQHQMQFGQPGFFIQNPIYQQPGEEIHDV